MSDQINSTRIVIDDDGNVVYSAAHGPYGDIQKEWVKTYDPKQKFSGKERENYTDLDYFGARYYDNHSYRFISVDPVINKKEALANPQLWNLYSYCRNNPIRYLDPDGRLETDIYIHYTTLRSKKSDSFSAMKTRSGSGPLTPKEINGLYYPRYKYNVIMAVYLKGKHKDDLEILKHEMDHLEGYIWLYQKNVELLEESEKIGYSTCEEAEEAAKALFKKGKPVPKKWIKYDAKHISYWNKLWGKHQTKWAKWAKIGNFGDEK